MKIKRITILALMCSLIAGISCNEAKKKSDEETTQKQDTVPTEIANITVPDIFWHLYSDPVTVKYATNHHMDYLNSKEVIYHPGSTEALRSFFLDYEDLKLLYSKADPSTGVRIYLGVNKDGSGKDSINLILVPTDKYKENILNNYEIVNTLSPCPKDCPTQTGAGKLNSKNDLNYDAAGAGGDYHWRIKLKTETKPTFENENMSARKEL